MPNAEKFPIRRAKKSAQTISEKNMRRVLFRLSAIGEIPMSFAFLPLYTGYYLRDTQHLSCSEHGIFLKFLMHCWDQKGPLPKDERKLMGICNARSGDEVEAMRRVLNEFFTAMDDGHYNGRMQREIDRAEAISGQRSKAAMIRHANAVQMHASADHLLARGATPTPTLTPTPKTTKTKIQKTFVSNSDEFGNDIQKIIEHLNKKTGKRFRASGAISSTIQARLKAGATAEECVAVIDCKAKEWLYDPEFKQYLRPKTLFSKTNFENYIGEINLETVRKVPDKVR